MKYTKGEWITFKSEESGLWHIYANGKYIGCLLPEEEANAHLIASAPDLYEALKELVERDSYGSIRLPTQARDIMVKALTKVEGK